MDTVEPHKRSLIMSRIKEKNSAPELALRKLLHSMGYRYRLHLASLPGRPDLVFPRRRAVIFMHGCFWHRHEGCALARLPKSRLEFWIPKLEAKRLRDALTTAKLRQQGWRVLIVWECELRKTAELQDRLVRFLEGNDESG